MAGVHDLATTTSDAGIRVTFDVDNSEMGRVLPAVSALGVHSFTAQPPSLEELFMRHYGDELAADGVQVDGVTSKAGAR